MKIVMMILSATQLPKLSKLSWKLMETLKNMISSRKKLKFLEMNVFQSSLKMPFISKLMKYLLFLMKRSKNFPRNSKQQKNSSKAKVLIHPSLILLSWSKKKQQKTSGKWLQLWHLMNMMLLQSIQNLQSVSSLTTN